MAIQEIYTITTEKKLRDKVIAAIGDKVNLISMRGDVAIVEHKVTKERFSVVNKYLTTMNLTYDTLKKIVPTLPKNADVFIPYLNEMIGLFEINTPRRLAGFISQIAHESGGFKYTVEIASGDAYENRKDLGNIYPGDGKRFKGRGLIQVTGRNNYAAMGKELGQDFVKNPDLLAAPQFAVKSAAIFWRNIKGNGLMDLPDTWRSKTRKYDPFQMLTYKVNGGQNGYADRLQYFNRALQVLS